MPGCELAAEGGDNPTVLALASYPVFVVFNRHGREANLHVEFGGLEKQVLHKVARHVAVGFHEETERERVVDVGLAYVEDAGIVFCKYFSEGACHAGAVGA